jgi:hypothetical protein
MLQLAALAVVLGGLLWYRFGPTTPTALTSNRQVQAPAVTIGTMRLPDPLKLSALAAAPDTAEIGRNPFAYGTRPAPPMPQAAPPPPPVPVQTGPPVPQGPPPITLTLAGIVAIPESERAMVTLRDPETGALFQAFEGDIVDGRYRVVKVGLQSVIVSYLDGSGSRTIPLGR